jgi:hypothetical protein
MRKTLTLALFLSIASYGLFSASAGGPIFWRINTRAEVEKGDPQGLTISETGAMTLAPTVAEVFDTKQAYIWSATADNAGNIYLGTGHEGRVYKVDAAGKGSLLYKTAELDVMAIVCDKQGNVYAGTAPDGKVYRITPSGEAKVFFDPKTKYIWSMAFDQQGRLLVGTGDKGVIFRVAPDGKGAPFVNTSQTNITTLNVDGAGNLIAGADPGGLILRIAPDGKAFTLFDSSQREIRDVAIARNGDIYALALSESASGGGANAATPAAPTTAPAVQGGDEGGVTITISDMQVVDSSGGSSTSSTSGSSGGQSKAALYKLDASGASTLLWDSKDAAAFSLNLDRSEQRVIVGSGQKGRIFSASEGQKPSLLAQLSEGQTSRFVRSRDQLFAATSNLGKLFKLSDDVGTSGVYTSAVRDAQITTQWGRVAWVGEGSIEVQTRSGNTANPDSTWSDWSPPASSADGAAIQSPAARFLQWKATLKKTGAAASPRLREVTVSYLPKNIAPRITSITVLPAGVSLQALPQPIADAGGDASGADASAAGGVIQQIPPRRLFQRGAISLQWQAEDRNGDTMEYSIFYKAANSAGDFYPLKTATRDNYFTVDPNALPDGRYIFKVQVTDGLSNPGNLALSDEQETEAVEIDNAPPVVSAEAPRLNNLTLEIVFRASDAVSIIRRAEYQLDGGAWKSIFPVDGIADSKQEEFRVSLTLPDAKRHTVAFRAFDANSNVGSAQVPIESR